MSSSFRKTVEKIAQAAGEGDRRACSRCQTPTAIATLSQYGGRCNGCFEAYCAEAFGPKPHGYDTVHQAEMRARLKADRPTRATPAEEREIDFTEAKAEAKRKVEEFLRHQSRDGSVTRARAFAGAPR